MSYYNNYLEYEDGKRDANYGSPDIGRYRDWHSEYDANDYERGYDEAREDQRRKEERQEDYWNQFNEES